jgi:hypothetical protein
MATLSLPNLPLYLYRYRSVSPRGVTLSRYR